MKKLSLKNLKLEVGDMLQRNQLKTVFGGYGGYSGGGNCTIYCRISFAGGILGEYSVSKCPSTSSEIITFCKNKNHSEATSSSSCGGGSSCAP